MTTLSNLSFPEKGHGLFLKKGEACSRKHGKKKVGHMKVQVFKRKKERVGHLKVQVFKKERERENERERDSPCPKKKE